MPPIPTRADHSAVQEVVGEAGTPHLAAPTISPARALTPLTAWLLRSFSLLPFLPAVVEWTNFTGLFVHPLHLHSGTMTVGDSGTLHCPEAVLESSA